jgi:hypothetical protein
MSEPLRRILTIGAVVVALLYSPSARSQEKLDGNSLLDRCSDVVKYIDNPKANGDDYKGAYCLGFIAGMEEAREAVAMSYSKTYEEYTKIDVLGIKVPENVSYGQIARVLVKWLQDNPKHLHESASLVYVLAMRDAFPAPVKDIEKASTR